MLSWLLARSISKESKAYIPVLLSIVAILALIVPFESNWPSSHQTVNRGKYHGGQIAFPGGKMEKKKMPMLYRQLYGNVTKK